MSDARSRPGARGRPTRAGGGALVASGVLIAVVVACRGGDRPPGVVTGGARSRAEVAADSARQDAAVASIARRAAPGAGRAKQILFGDLHVHTTYSLDAFAMELPLTGLQGVHTPADACDFARHCAKLDFFSLDDHAESLTPAHWQATKDVVRRCNALAGDPMPPGIQSGAEVNRKSHCCASAAAGASVPK